MDTKTTTGHSPEPGEGDYGLGIPRSRVEGARVVSDEKIEETRRPKDADLPKTTTRHSPEPREGDYGLARLRQQSLLTDDNLLIFRDRTPKGRHYTERRGAPPTRLQDSSFGAGCFGNAKSS